ncbi:MAG TPA: insulinase family protein, partial [Allosphingosinicella sp.]
LLEKSFGSWRADGPKPRRAAPAQLSLMRGTQALAIASTAMPNLVSACRVAAAEDDRKPSLARVRKESLSGLWTQIYNERLLRRANAPGSSLLGGAALVGTGIPDSRGTCVVGVPVEGKWQDALATLQSELRRLEKDGPTDTEVETGISQLRIKAELEEIGGGTRKTPALADEIVEAQTAGTVVEAPAKRLESLDSAIASATPADVREAIAADWSGSGPSIALVASQPVEQASLAAAWTAGEEAGPLTAYADAEDVEWPYVDFGKKGKVAKRLPVPVAGVSRFAFKNGVTVSFRKTDSSEPAEVRVILGHGERALSAALRQPAQLAAGMLPIGGLGKLDYDGIRRAIGHDGWTFTLSPGPDSWAMKASSYSYGLEQELQVLAAFLTDPGFRPLIDEKLPTAIDIAYRMGAAEPAVAARDAIDEKFFPTQKAFPPRRELDEMGSAELARLLKPVLTGAPIELTIVGNITEKEMRRMVARTFGALPPRAPLAAPDGNGPFRHFSEDRPAPLTAFHQGPADKAAVMVVWPLWVGSPERRQEEYAVNLLAAIFEQRLFQRLRVETGRTYAPSVSNTMPDAGDQGILTVLVDGAPGETDGISQAIREVAAELKNGKVTQEEIDRAREPLIAQMRQRLATNDVWADTIAVSFRHPQVFDEVVGYERLVKAVSLDHVRGAAAAWLAQTPVVGLGMPAPAKAAASPEGGPKGPQAGSAPSAR